jgi:hypothetical protein
MASYPLLVSQKPLNNRTSLTDVTESGKVGAYKQLFNAITGEKHNI